MIHTLFNNYTIVNCIFYNTYDNKYLQYNIIITRIWLDNQVLGGDED